MVLNHYEHGIIIKFEETELSGMQAFFTLEKNGENHHQKFSFSEWYSNMKITFVFLNSNIDKAVKKISKFI